MSPGSSDQDAAAAAATKKDEELTAGQANNIKDLMQFNPDESKIPNGTSDINLDPLSGSANSQVAARPDHNREVHIMISLLYY